MTFAPSSACLALIRKSESCKLAAYQDSGGVWTIGYGSTSGVHEGLVWTQEQADRALGIDVAHAAASVPKCATQGQFDALTDFVFNLGIGQARGSTLFRLHNAGKHAEAAAEFGKWVHQGWNILPGLVIRRARETLMYLEAA